MTRGACALITNRSHHVLLVRSLTSIRFTDYWSLTGGVVQDNETYEQGAIRETLEEVGLTIKLGEKVSVVVSIDDDFTAVTFRAFYVSGDIQLQVHEIEKAEWFTIDEAQKLKLALNIKALIQQF